MSENITKIQDQVTHPVVTLEDDGCGNYGISGIGFLNTDGVFTDNPTKFNPEFTVRSTNPEQKTEYLYDGTENRSELGNYVDGHYRKGYSHSEVADFIKEKLSPALNMARFSSDGLTNPLVTWLTGSSEKVNVGSASPDRQIFINSFGKYIRTGDYNRFEKFYPSQSEIIARQDSSTRRWSPWMITNHVSQMMTGHDKSAVVSDYPFAYNSEYLGNLIHGYNRFYSGAHVPEDISIDSWRIAFGSSTSITVSARLRPFTVESIYYQRENSRHNNITLDLTSVPGKKNISGRQHLCVAHTLDTEDRSPNDFSNTPRSSYSEYSTDQLATDLSTFKTTNVTSDYGILASVVIGAVTTYIFSAHTNADGIELVERPGSGTMPVGTLWYEVVGSEVAVHLSDPGTSVNVIKYSTGALRSVSQMIADLQRNLILIPNLISITTINGISALPVNAKLKLLDSYSTLFSVNSQVDISQTIHKQKKVRSKKTFVHLPTPVSLYDGQTVELDVSIPRFDYPETPVFPFNTIGNLSSYRAFVTQPRVYVFTGTQKCYKRGEVIPNSITYTSVSTVVNGDLTKTITFNAPNEIPISNPAVRISGATAQDIYNGDYDSVKTNSHISITVSGDYPTLNASNQNLNLSWLMPVSSISVTTLSSEIVSGGNLATLIVTPSLAIYDSINIMVQISGANNQYFNGLFEAVVDTDNTIVFFVESPIAVANVTGARIDAMVVAHAPNSPENVPGYSVNGLTERQNGYMFGVNPEQEGIDVDSGYPYHQRPMGISDINSHDKRVLVATVYPTTTNTFGWKLYGERGISMLPLNIFQLAGMSGSASHQGYLKTLSIYNEMNSIGTSPIFNFALQENPLSYNGIYSDISIFNDNWIPVNCGLRVKLPGTLSEATDPNYQPPEAERKYYSYTYQADIAHRQLIAEFLSSKISVNANTLNQSAVIGYNNYTPSLTYPTNYSSILNFNSTYGTSVGVARLYEKALYVPQNGINTLGDTYFPGKASYNAAGSGVKTWLGYYANPEECSNSGTDNHPYDLDPITDPKYTHGVPSGSLFLKYMTESTTDQIALRDYYRLARDWVSVSGANKDLTRFSTFDASFSGTLWSPSSRVFSTDWLAIPDFSLISGADMIESIDTITGSADANYIIAETALKKSLDSNPGLRKFYQTATVTAGTYSQKTTAGIIDSSYNISAQYFSDSTLSPQLAATVTEENAEYMRLHVPGYSAKQALRFYSGTRLQILGNSGATEPTDNASKWSFNSVFKDYFAKNWGTAPTVSTESSIARYVDDNTILVNSAAVAISVTNHNEDYMTLGSGNMRTLISASGAQYLADREFYQETMSRSYIRVKMKFIFSRKAGRWLTLDYRQAPTSYLTPTIGSVALSHKEDSSYIWQGSREYGDDAYTDLWKIPYYKMSPMDLTISALIKMGGKPFYDNSGKLLINMSDISDSDDSSYRFVRLIDPVTGFTGTFIDDGFTKVNGIDWIVPNNATGGYVNPNLNLKGFQPLPWKLYWHMRPAVSAMVGCDIPSTYLRSSKLGAMSDPCLFNMFSFPPREMVGLYPNKYAAAEIDYTIPWHENMDKNWLWYTVTGMDGAITGDVSRSEFSYIDPITSPRP